MRLTCSLMLLMPSGPSRLTACFTRSVRPQLSIRKPRSCRNFASVEAASSLLEAQTQSSVLKGKAQDSQGRQECCIIPQHHKEEKGAGKKKNNLKLHLWAFLFHMSDVFLCAHIERLAAHTHKHTAALGQAHCSQPYRSWRGSQSTPGRSSLAACRTSSLSTEKLRLCSV